MTNERPARIYIAVVNGMASVEAVDGAVEVVLVDFDREGDASPSEQDVQELFCPELHTGSAETFDGTVSAGIEDAKREFVEGYVRRPG
jgi:hypothetical protein